MADALHPEFQKDGDCQRSCFWSLESVYVDSKYESDIFINRRRSTAAQKPLQSSSLYASHAQGTKRGEPSFIWDGRRTCVPIPEITFKQIHLKTLNAHSGNVRRNKKGRKKNIWSPFYWRGPSISEADAGILRLAHLHVGWLAPFSTCCCQGIWVMLPVITALSPPI